jgi:hypothetical protein
MILHQVSNGAKEHDSLAEKAGKTADALSKKHFDPDNPISVESAGNHLEIRTG